MPAGPDTIAYRAHLVRLSTELRELRGNLDDFADVLGTASTVVGGVNTTGTVAGGIRKGIDKLNSVLENTKKAGPLVDIATRFAEVLTDSVRPAVKRIEDKVKDINNIGTGEGETQGSFLTKLNLSLKAAEASLRQVSDDVLQAELDLIAQADRMGNAITAIDAATDSSRETFVSDASWASNFTDLADAIDDQLEGRNAAITDLVSSFDAVNGRVAQIRATLDAATLDPALAAAQQLKTIAGAIDIISGPLNAAAAALEPIKPLLNTVGFVYDLVVQPVIDFILDKLGINTLLESVRAELEGLLELPGDIPFGAFLDGLESQIGDLSDQVDAFVSDGFGIISGGVGYLPDLEDAVLGGGFGAATSAPGTGPTWFGETGDDSISLGSRGEGALLDGGAGDDTVRGGAGNDIVLASLGDDIVDGGDGTDLIYFAGNFNEYELVRDGDSGPITITHVLPGRGQDNQGAETIRNFEFVVFRNIAFEGATLEAAQSGGSVLDGSNDDDLMFLNSTGTRVDDDGNPFDAETNPSGNGPFLYEANGFDGNDYIFGSTSGDRLNGGRGNDVFLPGRGDDQVNGDAGTDTYQTLDNGGRVNVDADLAIGEVFHRNSGGEGFDTVSSIENLILQDGGDDVIFGNSRDNSLLTSAGRDLAFGRGGNDLIDTGDGNDILIGGDGVDLLLGGKGDDILIGGGRSVAGQSEIYDGGSNGAGGDTLGFSRIQGAYGDTAPINSTSLPVGTGDLGNILRNQTEATGPLRIFAETGVVQHLDAPDGDVIATDTAIGIENFIGSDADDVIFGRLGVFDNVVRLHGGGGDDTIHSQGASSTFGGTGDDRLIVTLVEGRGLSVPRFDGGGGFDTLDLRPLGDVEWRLESGTSATELAIRAFSVTDDTDSGFFANTSEIEQFLLSGQNDRIMFDPGGSANVGRFRAGDGDDHFMSRNGFAIFEAGNGDDTAEFGREGEFFGGNGNDHLVWNGAASSSASRALGDAGDDYMRLDRFRGEAEGGDGFDILAFDVIAGVNVDLANGIYRYAGDTVNGGAISDFEQVIGGRGRDTLTGGSETDRIAGRDGNDIIRGGAQADTLFGNEGNDVLEGGAGDDILHGGRGNDTLRGDDGRDTASFASAHLGGLNGELVAPTFTGITANLAISRATGAQGTDLLIGIENLFGSVGADRLIGNSQGNILSGGRGADTLTGLDGDDTILIEGADTAAGGTGHDIFFAKEGNFRVFGEDGNDTVDFSAIDGGVTLTGGTGFTMRAAVDTPVWIDTGTTEARSGLTPGMVLETDILFADSTSDLTRIVPDEIRFDIATQRQMREFQGEMSGVETVIGSRGGDRLVALQGIEQDMLNLNPGSETGQAALAVRIPMPTGDVTVEMLFQATDAPDPATALMTLLSYAVPGDFEELLIFAYPEGNFSGDIGVRVNGTNHLSGVPTSELLNGELHRISVSYESATGQVRLYMNGEVIASGTSAAGGLGTNGTLVLGQEQDALAGGFDVSNLGRGAVADIRIWESVRTKTEILQNAFRDVPDPASDPDLVANWRVDGANGEVRDVLGGPSLSYNNYLGGTTAGFLLAERGLHLDGEAGRDTILGGNGNDTLMGGAGDDTLAGRDGNEDIRAGADDDLAYGNDGTDTLRGEAGNDTLSGGNGRDVLSGNAGRDALSGGNDDDRMFGGDDNDTMQGEEGDDDLRGGDGADDLSGGEGADVMAGNDGDDTLRGGAGGDRMFGGNRDDLINADGGHDLADGGTGNDLIRGNDGNDTLLGQDGADSLVGGDGRDDMRGGTGNDLFYGNDGVDTMRGEAGNDRMFGGQANDVIAGNDGNDQLSGGTGNDRMFGGTGNDRLDGEEGADTIRGDDGDDTLLGGAGDDLLSGNSDDDDLRGDAGSDRIFGGGGDDFVLGDIGDDTMDGSNGEDTMAGGDGADDIRGGDDDDRIFGNDDADILRGEDGNDEISGGNGDDTLSGSSGNDLLRGGNGADRLIGGSGRDTLEGGAGGDVFVFSRQSDSPQTSGRDTILDFEVGVDLIDLSDFAGSFSFVTSYTGADNEVRYVAGIERLFINFDGGASDMSINLDGVTRLTAEDLIL